MEARTEAELPRGPGWQYEPKWDGFRCLAIRAGDNVELRADPASRSARYFPDIVAALKALKPSASCSMGSSSFRSATTLSSMHCSAPASRRQPRAQARRRDAGDPDRVRPAAGQTARVAARTPLERAPRERSKPSACARRLTALRLSPASTAAPKPTLAERAGGGALDGVVAKRLDEPYKSGERAMVKVKRLRTADCVVGGFRYATNSRWSVRCCSACSTTTASSTMSVSPRAFPRRREALTRKVEAFRGRPGFTGDAPGGPTPEVSRSGQVS